MGNILAYPGSDFALAMREPALLVPGKKAVGTVSLKQNHPLARSLVTGILHKGATTEWWDRDHRISGLTTVNVTSSGEDSFFNAGYLLSGKGETSEYNLSESTILVGGEFPSTGSTLAVASVEKIGAVGEASAHCTRLSTNNIRLYTYESTGVAIDSTDTFTSDEPVSLGWLRSGTTGSFAINGAYDSGGWQTIQPVGSLDERLVIGAAARDLTQSNTGTYYYTYIFDRVLSEEELRSLKDDPYQLWESANRAPYLVPGPAGGVTSTVDGLLQVADTLTAQVNAVLQKTGTSTADLDAILQATNTIASSVDAMLQSAGTSSASLDAVLYKARDLTATLDAALQKSLSVTASADALLQKALSVEISVDASLQKAQSETATLDAMLQRTGSAGASLDALLQQAGVTVSATLDALLQATITATASVDAMLQTTGIVTTSVDAAISVNRSLTSTIDALLHQIGWYEGALTTINAVSGALVATPAVNGSITIN